MPSYIWDLPFEPDAVEDDDKRSFLDYMDQFCDLIKTDNEQDARVLISYRTAATVYNLMSVYGYTYEKDHQGLDMIYSGIYQDLCHDAGLSVRASNE